MGLTLFWSYKDNIGGHVWIGQPRVELKLVNHGGNVIHYPTQLTIKGYVDRLRLKSLYNAWYTSTNKGIINAFIKRWHSETSSFHLQV